MNKIALEYMMKGLAIAEKDLAELKKELDEYIHVDTSSRKSMDRYFELRDKGYDMLKATDKIVDIEMAISDINNYLYMHRKRHGIK